MLGSKISIYHALLFILKLKVIKSWNYLGIQFQKSLSTSANSSKRSGTLSKGGNNLIRGVNFLILILLMSFFFAFSVVKLFSDNLPGEQFLFGMSALLTILFLTSIFISIGYKSKNLVSMDSDVEALLTLPVSNTTIYLSRLIEYFVLNLGWIFIFPVFIFSLWYLGYRYSAIFIALILTLIINFLLSVIRLSLELFCRRLLSVYVLSNVEVVAMIVGMTLFFIFYYTCGFILYQVNFGNFSTTTYHFWLMKIGNVTLYFIPGLLLNLVYAGKLSTSIALPLFFELTGIVVVGWKLIIWASYLGLEAVQGNRLGQRNIKPSKKRTFFSGIIHTDLLLLCRSKKILLYLIGPYTLLSLLLFFPFPGIESIRNYIIQNPLHWGACILFTGFTGFSLILPTLFSYEGSALWVIYTVPHSLQSIIKQKSYFWIGVVWVVSFIFLIIGILLRKGVQYEDVTVTIFTLLCFPMYAIICISWGIFLTNPFEQSANQNPRVDILLIIQFLSIILVAGMYTPGLRGKLCFLIILSLLAVTLWQKAAVYADYILDPLIFPSAKIYAADGLFAILFSFLLQLIFALYGSFAFSVTIDSITLSLVSYCIGTGLTTVTILFYFRSEGLVLRNAIPFWIQNLEEARRTIIITLKAAFGVIMIGILSAYFFPNKSIFLNSMPKDLANAYFLVGLLIVTLMVIKPIFEEIVYRGILFQGLRDSMGFGGAAVLSSIIFAMFQPLYLVIPTFLVGVIIAWAYQRVGILFTPLFLNIVYILSFISSQFFLQFHSVTK